MTIKEFLLASVDNFKKWRSQNYSEEKILINAVDDPSYPDWDEIRDYFKTLLISKQLPLFDDDDRINLLYLISRSYDDTPFLAELTEGRPISHYGEFPDHEFIKLARIASKTYGVEYDDGKASIAICFRKLESLNSESEEILIQLYDDENEYTKRQALLSLAKLGYGNINSLIAKSWQINDEWHKIGCLMALHYYGNDKRLLLNYMNEVKDNNMEYLVSYVQELREKKCN